MKKLPKGDSNIDIIADKIQQAAQAVGTNLDPVYKYIVEHQNRTGQELIRESGNMFFHSHLNSNPKIMKLWNNAAQWEKENSTSIEKDRFSESREIENLMKNAALPGDELTFNLEISESSAEKQLE